MNSPTLISPPDKRDYPVTAALDMPGAALPKDFAVWQPPIIENQGDTGNCVAQVISLIFECIEYQQTGKHREHSVGYIYGKSCIPDRPGMYPRDACEIALKHGDVERLLWECFYENPTCAEKRAQVDEHIQTQAKRITKFVRLNSKEEAQAFMYKYGLPILFTSFTQSFELGSGDGAHAVAVYGWESEETFYQKHVSDEPYRDFLYTNSWGTSWLDADGRGNVNSNNAIEMWGLVPMERKKLTDVEGHWAEKDISDAYERGYINGYPDGTYLPENEVKRGEIATVMMNKDRIDEAKFNALNERIEFLEKMFGIRR